VKTLFAIVLTLGLLAASAFAQTCPTGQTQCITQVSNAASEALTPLPNASIAQGSYFSIYGVGFGPAFSTCGANNGCLWSPYPLPTAILQTSVNVSVPAGATPIPAYVEFAANFGSYSQINAIMPSTVPPGTGTVTVTTAGTTTATFPITVVAMSFGTFSINQAGTGPGIITDTNYAVLTPFHTIPPSTSSTASYAIIWGTGLGVAPDIATEGTAAPTPTNLCATASSCPVTVWVAGQKANIYYAGRSGYTAEDQIVFEVPQGVQGCYVQVAVQTGSVVGNFTSMTVDPTGPTCSDADGINYASLAAVTLSKGKASVGAISLLSNFLNLSVLGTPLQWDNDTVSGEIATFSTFQLGTFQGFTLAPSVNNCSVSPFLQYPPPKDPVLSEIAYLDAGASLSIQGPSGSPVSVPKNTNGKGYSALVGGSTIAQLISGNGIDPFFLNATGWGTSSWTYAILPGTFTMTGPGGADVGAFSLPVNVSSTAASFKWTNESIASNPISRSTPLTITWSGGDPNGFVDITLISSTLQSGTTPAPTTPGILVECIAPSSAQTFTVPLYVMQSMPSTAGSTALVPPGELLVGPASAASSPTTLPTGLDALYIFYHYIGGSEVTWE
jgi:uncharacterized protein (TIGR03437 family)